MIKITKTKQLLLEIGLIIVGFIIFGIIEDRSLFSIDLGGWMILVGGAWFIGTLFSTFIYSPIQYSITVMITCIFLIFFGGVIHDPGPPNGVPYEVRNGTSPSSTWDLSITYRKDGLRYESRYSFTGTVDDSSIALQEVISRWNQENPSMPVVGSRKVLLSFPSQ